MRRIKKKETRSTCSLAHLRARFIWVSYKYLKIYHCYSETIPECLAHYHAFSDFRWLNFCKTHIPNLDLFVVYPWFCPLHWLTRLNPELSYDTPLYLFVQSTDQMSIWTAVSMAMAPALWSPCLRVLVSRPSELEPQQTHCQFVCSFSPFDANFLLFLQTVTWTCSAHHQRNRKSTTMKRTRLVWIYLQVLFLYSVVFC